MSDDTRDEANKISNQFKTQNPRLYETFKNDLKEGLEKQKKKSNLTDRDILKLINQYIIPTKDGKVIKNNKGPMKDVDLSESRRKKSLVGGKRTRKRRRNSRKKKVVKRR